MTTRKILDWSNYTGVPTLAKIAELKADGWEGVILGTQFPSITRQQYGACNAGAFTEQNLPVEALYVFVYWDGEDGRRIQEAITLADDFHLKVWIDCEWTKTGYPGTGTWAPDPAHLVALIHLYKDTLGPRYAGIYTGRWWWPPYTNDNQDFAQDALWHAAYSEPDFEHFIPYGGWTAVTEQHLASEVDIWQFSSAGTLGVNADLNVELLAPVGVIVPAVGEMKDAAHELGYWMYRGWWNLAEMSPEMRTAIKYAASLVPN